MSVGLVVLALAILIIGRLAPDGRTALGAAGSTTTVKATPATAVVDPAVLGGISFTDVTRGAGLASSQSARPVRGLAGMTSGASVVDVDGDGRPDIFLSRIGKPNALYRNDGDGTFTDIAKSVGLASNDAGGTTTAMFADLDGDGDEDAVLARVAAAPPALYINDGGLFRDDSSARGFQFPLPVTSPDSTVHGITSADVNHDGSLDLLVTDWTLELGWRASIGQSSSNGKDPRAASSGVCGQMSALLAQVRDADPIGQPTRSRLFLNDGTGHFTDATTAMGLGQLNRVVGFTPQFVDLDGDGWEDLLVAGDYCTSRIFRNDGGHGFTDVTAGSGVGTDENAMGSLVADFNGDGLPDWFVSGISGPTKDGACPSGELLIGCSGNRLYLNRGNLTFEDVSVAKGIRSSGWGWGAAYEDFGNDGRRELVVVNGYDDDSGSDERFYQPFRRDPLAFYLPTSDDFVDGAQAAGLRDDDIGHALVPFDFDGDGRLDLLVANSNTAPRLYRNVTPLRRSLTVALHDPGQPGNVAGVGSRVAVTTSDRDTPTVGWITGSGSYETSRPPEFHVGLGSNSTVKKIEVWWPGTATPQTVVPAGNAPTLVVTRGP